MFISCNNRINPDQLTDEPNSVIEYFKNAIPTDSTYFTNFNKEYNRYQTSNLVDSSGKLLIAFGNALYANSMKSDTFKLYSLGYFSNHKPNENNIIYYQLSNMIACNFMAENNIDSAAHWFQKGMNSISEKAFQKSNGFACSEMGTLFLSTSDFDSAEHYYLKAIHSFEQINDTSNLTTNYLTMSAIFQNLHEWNMANQYIERAYQLQAGSKDTDMLLGCLNMKASIKNEGFTDTINFIKLVDSSTYIFQRYSKPSIYELFNQHLMQFESCILQHKFTEAGSHLKTCDSANHIMLNDGMQMQIDYMKCMLANESHLTEPNSPNAESLALNFGGMNQHIYASRLYNALRNSAVRESDYYSAYKYNIAYQRSNDSLLQQNNRGQLLELERKYESEKKEKQILAQNSKLLKSKFQIGVLLFSLVGILMTSFIFFGYKKRKQAQSETILQQQYTDALIQNTEDERKRIASDLHDGVNHELLTLKNKINSGNKIHSNEIDQVIQEVRQVSRDLYPAMFDNIGLKASIEALCERLTEIGLFTTCDINYTSKLSKRNELQLYRIIQEALNNTLKHAKANAAKVTIETKGNELFVEIKDNGIGFDTNEKTKDHASFGLQSFLQRARAIGGKSHIDSNSSGTTLILTAPLH